MAKNWLIQVRVKRYGRWSSWQNTVNAYETRAQAYDVVKRMRSAHDRRSGEPDRQYRLHKRVPKSSRTRRA